MSHKPITGWKRAALNVFIAVHVTFLVVWGLPSSLFRTRLCEPITSYMIYLGLWHSWSMFAPTPLATHFDVRAQVAYQDGSTNEWIAPRMEELPLWERVPKERYRKWRERIRIDEYMSIWDDTARFVARRMNTNPTNPPVEVKLTRYWVDIPPPNKTNDFQPMPRSFKTEKEYTYAVCPILPKDLKK